MTVVTVVTVVTVMTVVVVVWHPICPTNPKILQFLIYKSIQMTLKSFATIDWIGNFTRDFLLAKV
jgi:hypothetical protein